MFDGLSYADLVDFTDVIQEFNLIFALAVTIYALRAMYAAFYRLISK